MSFPGVTKGLLSEVSVLRSDMMSAFTCNTLSLRAEVDFFTFNYSVKIVSFILFRFLTLLSSSLTSVRS